MSPGCDQETAGLDLGKRDTQERSLCARGVRRGRAARAPRPSLALRTPFFLQPPRWLRHPAAASSGSGSSVRLARLHYCPQQRSESQDGPRGPLPSPGTARTLCSWGGAGRSPGPPRALTPAPAGVPDPELVGLPSGARARRGVGAALAPGQTRSSMCQPRISSYAGVGCAAPVPALPRQLRHLLLLWEFMAQNTSATRAPARPGARLRRLARRPGEAGAASASPRSPWHITEFRRIFTVHFMKMKGDLKEN